MKASFILIAIEKFFRYIKFWKLKYFEVIQFTTRYTFSHIEEPSFQ